MALSFTYDSDISISFDDFITNINKKIQSPNDEEGLLKCSIDLHHLSNNSSFFIDYLNKELSTNLDSFQKGNVYTCQSFMLYRNDNFYVRVNWWPIFQESDNFYDGLVTNFSYGLVHDHNFPLLTVGYKGAYTTKIWEYDYDSVEGIIGEKVDLFFLEETNLTKGKVMYFRPSKDIHKQLMPKDEISISINIILDSPLIKRQYAFDEISNKISRILYLPSGDYFSFMKLVEYFYDDETIDILERMGKSSRIEINNAANKTLQKILNNISST